MIANLFKAAVLVAIAYLVATNWDMLGSRNSEIEGVADSNCRDGINQRFSPRTVSVYDVEANANGFTVRASITLANGDTARVYCLTNEHGGVEDISILQH